MIKLMSKLCVYGLAGSGKSTIAAAIAVNLKRRGLSCEIVSLAQPLYALAAHIYRTANVPAGKDNELLRTLAGQLRRINPRFLVQDFLLRVAASRADVVINDDMRNADV